MEENTFVWYPDLVRIHLTVVTGCTRWDSTAQCRSRLNHCTLYPWVVVAHHIFMVQSGQQLYFTSYLPVQLFAPWIQFNKFYSIHTTVQFITNLTKTRTGLWMISNISFPLNIFFWTQELARLMYKQANFWF